jgi:hypothetical protein
VCTRRGGGVLSTEAKKVESTVHKRRNLRTENDEIPERMVSEIRERRVDKCVQKCHAKGEVSME